MGASLRYFRLLRAFGRYCLANELAFRGNFIAKVLVEVLWLGILLIFYKTVFASTNVIAGWDQAQYLVFVGCYYTLEGIIETFFLENCSEFGELIRTGELDFFLLKPIDEQFLITCRRIDWSTAHKIPTGFGVIIWGLVMMSWEWDSLRVVSFALVFLCAIAMAYSFLLVLTSAGVWMVRNQSLMELWWLVSSLMRYPKEIYDGTWAWLIGRFFTYILPLLLVINMPAQVLAKALDPRLIALTFTATFVLLAGSRWIFFRALKSYRSASS